MTARLFHLRSSLSAFISNVAVVFYGVCPSGCPRRLSCRYFDDLFLFVHQESIRDGRCEPWIGPHSNDTRRLSGGKLDRTAEITRVTLRLRCSASTGRARATRSFEMRAYVQQKWVFVYFSSFPSGLRHVGRLTEQRCLQLHGLLQRRLL